MKRSSKRDFPSSIDRARPSGNGRNERALPIVGVGASAGGLEAFTQLLAEIPADTGMAFIFIQHLDPKHTSFLADALRGSTAMPVSQAKDGETIEANHIYVIPPEADISIREGRLSLGPRSEDARKLHLPIDFLFRSLAEERGRHAIGVVLSGTASDGTEGLRAIKDADGFTFAQDPSTAKFDGMPRSARDAGVVDYCLPLPEIARELIRLSRHSYVASKSDARDEVTLKKIQMLLRTALGTDFSEYKSPTFERRLARRMALRRAETLEQYLELLEKEPDEVGALFEDVLIHVTSFFRDPDVFEALDARVFPVILKGKAEDAPVRIWVAGCSTGEEVYSIAIVLLEHLGKSQRPIQIFGTDVSEKAIERARAGLYPDNLMRPVSEERRRRFFNRVEGGYRINKGVRDLCVFVKHDLAFDPPFSKLDLVSCRNVLIYFGSAMQKRVLPMLHYSLNPGAFLLLGQTESIGSFTEFFEPVDKANKFFIRTAAASTLRFAPRHEIHPAAAIRAGVPAVRRDVDLARNFDRAVLARYAPPGVLVNQRLEILRFSGDTSEYLRSPPGEPQSNLLKMARGSLVPVIRSALAKAEKTKDTVRVRGVSVDEKTSCDLVVSPFTGAAEAKDKLYLVLFEPGSPLAKAKAKRAAKAKPAKLPAPAARLERELAATREYLQSLIDERDRTNEDLNSANEELISANEELQSLNEEMETAKEELQSTNEELTTVNDELHSRNQEVSEINSDLVNILSTVDVPILILDRSRRIRRFTPRARSILNVLPSDIGRPLDDIKPNLVVTDLDAQVAEVIETNVMREVEVQDREGRWYRMQIRPYKTLENMIDGATLSLIDITVLKHHVSVAQEAKAEAERANRAKDDFLATLSHEIRTPLSSMLMHAQSLRRNAGDPAKVERAAAAIERGTKLQVELIDDMLDVSRIVTGKLKIEFADVDMKTVVQSAVEAISAQIAKKKLQLTVSLGEKIGVVSGDKTRLYQVVSNLLGNAVKFTPEGGSVSVTLEKADGHARLVVADTGVGIDPAFLPQIFNRFAQEDGSTGRRHGGLGLGLAIVQHLVEAHGGTIRAESAGHGKGSKFSVTLPLMRGRSADATGEFALPIDDETATKTARARLDGLRVLVVDDDVESRDVVAEILTDSGALVHVASSAAEAMEAVGTFHPEVLLCDIAMPGEDGYSFIRRLRALGPGHGGDLPAVALTALAGEANRQAALSAGFQMHLAKPVELNMLTRAVAELAHVTVH